MFSLKKKICQNNLLSFFSGIFTVTVRLKKRQKQQNISLLTMHYPKNLNNFEFFFISLFGFNPNIKKKKNLNILSIYKKSHINIVLNCVAPYIVDTLLLKEIKDHLISVSSQLPTILSETSYNEKTVNFSYYYLGFFYCAAYYKIGFSKLSLFESIKFRFVLKHKNYGLLQKFQQFLYINLNVSSSLYCHNNLYILHIQAHDSLLFLNKYCLTNFESLLLSNNTVFKTIVLILLIKSHYLLTVPLYLRLIKKLYWVLRFDI